MLNQSHSRPQTPLRNADGTPDVLSEGERSPWTTYEIPLEHDFVSPDADQTALPEHEEAGVAAIIGEPDLNRKMTARDFEPLLFLGKGTYGTVLLVRHIATGRLYAQKQFRKASLTVHKKLVEQTKTERTILESVNRHAFVVKLYYAFQDDETLYLILEYAQGGELFTHLAAERMFSEDVAAFYMAEMVLALDHLHRTVGVIYRDLKPENCLLDAEGHLLLTDFGLSKVALDPVDGSSGSDVSSACCNSFLGTVEYMAPEIIQGKAYGSAVDWWSLGALGFDLLTGAPPFRGSNHAKTQERIVKQKLALPYFLSPDAKDLLTRLLRKDPAKRLGGGRARGGGGAGGSLAKDIAAIKAHRFFRKIDWAALERRDLDPPIKPLITDPALAENFSAEFTELALGPAVVAGRASRARSSASADDDGSGVPRGVGLEVDDVAEPDPFGGFSYVASSSLFEWR